MPVLQVLWWPQLGLRRSGKLMEEDGEGVGGFEECVVEDPHSDMLSFGKYLMYFKQVYCLHNSSSRAYNANHAMLVAASNKSDIHKIKKLDFKQ